MASKSRSSSSSNVTTTNQVGPYQVQLHKISADALVTGHALNASSFNRLVEGQELWIKETARSYEALGGTVSNIAQTASNVANTNAATVAALGARAVPNTVEDLGKLATPALWVGGGVLALTLAVVLTRSKT